MLALFISLIFLRELSSKILSVLHFSDLITCISIMTTSGTHNHTPETNQSPTETFQYESLNSQQQDNPLYMHNSDSPGIKLVSEPFDGTGCGN